MSISQSQLTSELSALIRGEVFTDILHRAAYSTDASIYRIVPLCVVSPSDAGDIEAVIKYAGQNKIPLAARGAGSGLAGESLCSGIVLDMTRYINRLIATEDNGQTVVCEPGVVLDDLNKYLAGYGRKIGPDPSSSNRAVVGACVANNSTGAHSLQFGHFGKYVESIEAVLADGSIVEFKNDFDPTVSPNEKNSELAQKCLSLLRDKQQIINDAQPKTSRNRCGYSIAGICRSGQIDTARLLSGSEGTLAVFTKIKLRTVPLPATRVLLQLEFDSLEKMSQALPAIVNSGASACELMDKTLTNLAFDNLPQYSDILPRDAAVILLVEQSGESSQDVYEKISITDSAVGRLAFGRTTFFDPVTQARVWKLRKDAGPLLYRTRSKKHPAEFMEDVGVDFRQLGKYISGLQEIGRRYEFTFALFGHAGDGELHIRPYLDLTEPDERKKMQAIANDVFSLAWSLGGSISGEHAVGLSKAAYVRRQYGEPYYKLLCEIKHIFDPQSLLNPGKILNSDPDVMIKNLRRERKISTEIIKGDLLFDNNQLDIEIEQCNGCGLCLSRQAELRMCPVFRAMGEELASSRAKANLIHFRATGQLDEKDFESSEFKNFLDLCINCKACQRECPSGVDVSTLMTAARAQYIRGKSLRPAERLLSSNRYLSMLGSFISQISNFSLGQPVFTALLEKIVGIDRRRTLPRFEQGSFLNAGRKYLARLPRITNPIDKAAYFTDTFVNYNDHKLGFAVLDVLRANDIEVILPEQRPAPVPAVVYGDTKLARTDLLYNVNHLAESIRTGYKIVCSEPSAALTLKKELQHYIAGDDAKLVSNNTYELMNYLFDLLKQGKLKKPAGVKQLKTKEYLYHLPCHLSSVGEQTATSTVLQELCGIKITDLSAGCCGLAGTFGMQKKNYDLSSKIASRLKEALKKNPIKDVLTECSACRMQIEHISSSIVNHPIKIIADCYK
jgi:FAD/FMN-containing dehydrogenase/Fe-S oxidoreductase